jgi:hypothetical protein
MFASCQRLECIVNFRIADTFTDSLARLTGDEQKAVKTTAFDLQLDRETPGMQLHKIDRSKDRSAWCQPGQAANARASRLVSASSRRLTTFKQPYLTFHSAGP